MSLHVIKKSADKNSFDFSIIERELEAISSHLETLSQEVSK
ncbi:hypothetical protein [Variovorax sp. E3]